MSLPIPNLDDKTFEELFEELKKYIPIYAPEWTDHNLHDPGITLIDLFTWLAEMQMYSLNRISDRNLLKYLGILKARPLPAMPAKVDVKFTLDGFQTLPAGTKVKAVFPSSEVVFETDEAIEVLPLELKKIISYSDYRFSDVTEWNEPDCSFFYAFGENPRKGDALYLGFDSKKDSIEAKVRMGIYQFEEDLPSIGQHGDERLKVHPSAHVSWQYWSVNENGWMSLAVDGTEETIITLSRSGIITFNFKKEISKGKISCFYDRLDISDKYFWIRIKVDKPGYEIPPRIERVLLNTVPSTECQTYNDEIGTSSGFPCQVFKTTNIPIVPGSHKLTINSKIWVPVIDFDASKPEDKHYVIDLSKGEIHFGDGVKGSVPPNGEKITLEYKCGGGDRGNVLADTITTLEDGWSGEVANPFPAQGGKEKESIEEAFIRFRKDLKVAYPAVTAEDYEYITRETPGLRVARAKAMVSAVNRVRVIVVPYSYAEKPMPSEGFKRTVCEHMDRHRLITTCIQVKDPEYVRVSVKAAIRNKSGYSSEALKEKIMDTLNKFLSPIKRKEGDNAWPFGRTVYKSEVYEVIESVEGVDCVFKLNLIATEGTFTYKQGNIDIEDFSLVCPGRHDIQVIEPSSLCR